MGILPGWGLSQKLSRAIGIYRAKELSLSGNYLSAEQAAEWGLVNRVVEPAELLPACRALAVDMQSCVPEVMRAYKRLIDDGYAATFGDGLRIEATASRERAGGLTPAAIAARRAEVQARGRAQSKGEEKDRVSQQPVEKVETPFDKHVLSNVEGLRASGKSP